jgi:hypothetical protein
MESVGEGGYSYCSTDAATCWAYDLCDAGLPISGQCGNAEGLVCCPGSDGSEDSCRTADDCYADQPCTASAECSGGFICCQNAENGLANTCQSDAACDVFTPCAGAGAACPSDLFCCTESYLLSLDQPRCFESESICNFYKPCAASAACGDGSACCNVTGNAADAVCYPSETCPDDAELP